MDKLTERQLTKKLNDDINKCPYCGGENISSGDKDGGLDLSVAVACDDCGSDWYEHYRFFGASPGGEPGE